MEKEPLAGPEKTSPPKHILRNPQYNKETPSPQESIPVNIEYVEALLKNFAQQIEHFREKTKLLRAKPFDTESFDSLRALSSASMSRVERDIIRAFNILFITSPESSLRQREKYGPFFRHILDMEQVLRNLTCIARLERKTPGAVYFLNRQRGIGNFSVYSDIFWQRQFEERESTLPSVLIINPVLFGRYVATSSTVYLRFQDALKNLPTPHVMRLIEIEKLPDFLKLLVRLNKTYNATNTNPIRMVMYDGHGTSERILLSIEKGVMSILSASHISSERFEKIFSEHLFQAFSPECQFIFASCESAKKTKKTDPVAFALKKALQKFFSRNIVVVGSNDIVTPFSKIVPTLYNNVLRVECFFDSSDKDQKMRNL